MTFKEFKKHLIKELQPGKTGFLYYGSINLKYFDKTLPTEDCAIDFGVHIYSKDNKDKELKKMYNMVKRKALKEVNKLK